jgi:hypothetical protein
MELDDIVGNTETIERLKVIARDGNMPHIIISVFTCRKYTDIGNAWDWKDDEYNGARSCVVGRRIQRGCPGTKRFR